MRQLCCVAVMHSDFECILRNEAEAGSAFIAYSYFLVHHKCYAAECNDAIVFVG